MSGRAKSVKHFERSNGPDIALYKNYLFINQNKFIVKRNIALRVDTIIE